MTQRRTYVLVDGENIDATLGSNILGRRPNPDERPRWERVTSFFEEQWGQPVTGLFFLNASNGTLPSSFVQALIAMNYRPVPLAGRPDEKVVDIGIIRTLEALGDLENADVVLGSHDSDFVEAMTALIGNDRKVGLIGFKELTSTQLLIDGLQRFDLEYDVNAFQAELPRVRIIPLEEFDPMYFLR